MLLKDKNTPAFPPTGDDASDNISIPENASKDGDFPLLPLRDIVIYPHTIIPLSVSGNKAISAIEQAMQQSRIITVLAVKQKSEKKKDSELERDDFFEFGSTVLVHKMLRIPDGSIRLIVQGLDKVKVKALTQTTPFFRGEIEVVDETEKQSKRGQALIRNALSLLQKMINLVPYFPDEVQVTAMNMDDPVKLAYLLATFLRMNINERQEILEIGGGEKKLSKVISTLQKELDLLELGGKIQGEVKDKVGKAQREYFLREQMKAIQKELGEFDENQAEIKDIEKQLAKKKMPEEAKKEATRELKRLSRIPPAAAEYQVIHTYLRWILDIPWEESSKDKLDLNEAKKVLNEDHYGLDEIKDRIIEFLAVRKLKKDMHGPILCFVGPPGVGKTSLGKSIARAMDRKFIRLSLGGVHDEAEIRGHRRTYVGAMPGRIVQSLKRVGTNNPVFILDEIDKIGTDFRGDPSSALLEVLDPEQNGTFRDHYLDLPIDLSKVFFITTANVLNTIQPALRDRMEIIQLAGYSEEEKSQIARRYLIPKQVKEHGLKKTNITFEKDVVRAIIAGYTREAGVRNLEREIGKVCRKVAKNIATGSKKLVSVSTKNLKNFLGPVKVFPEAARKTPEVGVATGLAWTSTGGEVLFIEARKIPGKKNLMLTGQLGDVMKESAQIALSYIRSQTGHKLKIPKDFFETHELHLHVPAGAIPKDGPSAGITMLTAMASALTRRMVMTKMAMTGEITLRGK
ncbi:MAG: endopeptidase La, partial [bacterium]